MATNLAGLSTVQIAPLSETQIAALKDVPLFSGIAGANGVADALCAPIDLALDALIGPAIEAVIPDPVVAAAYPLTAERIEAACRAHCYAAGINPDAVYSDRDHKMMPRQEWTTVVDLIAPAVMAYLAWPHDELVAL